jgi:hypothetical protein
MGLQQHPSGYRRGGNTIATTMATAAARTMLDVVTPSVLNPAAMPPDEELTLTMPFVTAAVPSTGSRHVNEDVSMSSLFMPRYPNPFFTSERVGGFRSCCMSGNNAPPRKGLPT